MTEQDKVTVDDIIGIVKTEEQTNSVEEVRKLRGRENKTAKRFEFREINEPPMVPKVYDTEKQEYANLFECVGWLNELHEEVMDLRIENTKFKLIVSEIIEDMQKYVDDNQLIYINQSYVDWIKKEVDTTLYSQKKELEE